MIYVHVPFCRSFCTYCDFYSEVVGGGRLHKPSGELLPLRSSRTLPAFPASTRRVNLSPPGPSRFPRPREATSPDGFAASIYHKYTDDLCDEIEARRGEIAAAAGVRTLYIGGGTPSVLPLECLRRIVEKLREVEGAALVDGGLAGDWEEFTVEINPEDIIERGPGYVRGLLELGVNRISMGVQSMDPGMLRWMNRRHSADGAREAWRIISEVTRLSPVQGAPINRCIDLISGVPGMDCAMLGRTLNEVLEWRPEHISAYQLSVEEGSALARMIADGRAAELPDEECRAQYELLCRKLGAAGYHHYEISNWALPGHEAVHNSAYWTRQPYVGLGPGAHSLEYQNVSVANADQGCARKRPKTCTTPAKEEGMCTKKAKNVHNPRDGKGSDTEAILQIRKWNSKRPTGWAEEGREELSPEEIREETVMLLARTDRGPIPERDWFIADELIADLL